MNRLVSLAALLGVTLTTIAAPASAAPPERPPVPRPPTAKVPVMSGTGGAVSSVDETASRVGRDVLARGGNAVDAAVAMAATLGVTEPFSAGLGGGGFFVYYDARTRQVHTLDGRESAPGAFTPTTFTGLDGAPLDLAHVVTSGLSVGVPGTPATWEEAARRWGTRPLRALLAPAQRVAQRGVVVDAHFREQVVENESRFAMFPATASLFLPGGRPPAVGTVLRNRDLARTYRQLGTQGVRAFYTGPIGKDVVAAARAPKTVPGVRVPGSPMLRSDLSGYRVRTPAPVHSQHRGRHVYGMGVPGSGGVAVAQILNLMEVYAKRTVIPTADASRVDFLHRFAEASATAFADRNRWVGDVEGVPVAELTSPAFAAERGCRFDPARAAARPIPFGEPDGRDGGCPTGGPVTAAGREGESTTHLNVVDRWGNVVAYTLTIEQTGGSGITVPGRGFLLNNELTDFSFVPVTRGVPDPNLPGPGKRPRSSMAPTIVLDAERRPVLAAGSPGGSTIITTTAQIVLETLDRDTPLVEAIAAPRLSSRNTSASAETALIDSEVGRELAARGHAPTSVPRIGNASGLRMWPDGRVQAAAETTRGGGGSALVVRPDSPR